MNQQGWLEGAGHSSSLPVERDFMELSWQEMEANSHTLDVLNNSVINSTSTGLRALKSSTRA